jgi:hypothetical protein
MKTLPKILLTSSVIAFGLGLTGPGSEVWFGIFQPLGALLFVGFFITNLVSRLDPEQYEFDNRLRDTLLSQPKPTAVRSAAAERRVAKEAFAS